MTDFRTLLAEDDITLDSLVSIRVMEDDVDLIMVEITRHIKSLTALIVSEGNKLKSEKRNICVLRKKMLHLEGVREEIVKNMKFGRKRNDQIKVLPIMMGIDSDWINSQNFAKKCYYSWIIRKASLKKVHELDIQINTLDVTIKKARIAFYHNIRGFTNLKNDICKLHDFSMKIKDTASVIESPEVNNEVLEGNTEINDGSNPNKYIGDVNKILSDCMRTLSATKEIAMQFVEENEENDDYDQFIENKGIENRHHVEIERNQNIMDIEIQIHKKSDRQFDYVKNQLQKNEMREEIGNEPLPKSKEERGGGLNEARDEDAPGPSYANHVHSLKVPNLNQNKSDKEPIEARSDAETFLDNLINQGSGGLRSDTSDYEVILGSEDGSLCSNQSNMSANMDNRPWAEMREEIGNEPLPWNKEERSGGLNEARDEDAPGSSYANHAHSLKVPSLNQNKSDKEPVEARSDAETFLDNLINQGSGGLSSNNSDNEVILGSEGGSLCSNQSNMSANMDNRPWDLKFASYSGSVGNPLNVTINETSPGPLKNKLSDDLATNLMNNQETTLYELCCEMSTLEPYLVVTEKNNDNFELSNSFPELDAIEVSRLYWATDSERYAR